ncbi:MAG: alpha-1,4-glucan--maltose-1-phosphate maltosyltransferase [Variibacter sp.]|nr:alpha-1,4-glucan--maltose-1-phosphate maltosyltransferase [Variibacter sp.]
MHEPVRYAPLQLDPAPPTDAPRFFIEDVYPSVDGGRFPVKRIVGETVEVWVDILREGHDVLAARLLWGREGEPWRSEPMRLFDNDRWCGSFTPTEIGRYCYAIEAWTDTFGTWRRDFLVKRSAGQPVAVEAQEGRALLAAVRSGPPAALKVIAAAAAAFDATCDAEALLSEELLAAMAEAQPRPDLTRSLAFPLMIERERARVGAWYEMFPRSQSPVPGRHGTFDDCIARLPQIAALGYDVLYFPPIHPIGRTNRKGRNNALKAAPGDPGSPYAIGAEEGGHDAVHPELGTLEDFRRLIAACAEHGLEIALDFAIQCSPDHPWLKQHPEWFKRRPDGSLRYAENPPKKYEDIHNPDFYCADRAALWTAFRDVVQFWVDQGVRIFRVDNPHTKPFPFWEWLIRDIHSRHPDVIFLSEAFTRPKIMKALAKLGFSQSYTYFTWRTTKEELSAYMAELTRYPERDYFRPNFFVNTPDILPFHLQGGEPWMFKSRVALAATLSSNYGVYSGFELLEHEPLGPGREEYLNSEKYEIKWRDWNKPGNLNGYIARLNALRRENAALRQTSDFRFAQVDDDHVIGFVKESVARDNAVAVAIALTGGGPRTFWFHFGDLEIGPPSARRRVAAVENLQTGERLPIEWGGVRLTIDPNHDPALLFRCLA